MILSFALAAFIIVSCKKEKTEPAATNPTFQSEQDYAELDRENSNIYSYVSTTGDTSTQVRDGSSMLAACATISVSPIVGWPRTVTIDFGSVNTNSCGDGRNRRGKIFAKFNTPWIFHTVGDSVTVWTQDYYVNDIKHEGTRYIVIQDSVTIHVSAVNIRATWPDNTFATWDCERTRKFISGWSTPYVWLDDVYEHAGAGNGRNRLGELFTLQTRTGYPLIQKMNCHWIVQGILDFTPAAASTRTVNYGNGNCDNLAVVTVNGVDYNIILY